MFHEVGSLAYIMIIRRLDSSISSFELMSLPIALFIVVTESVTRGALVEGGGGGGEKEGVPAACHVTRPTPATQQGRARGPRAPRGGGEGQRASRWV